MRFFFCEDGSLLALVRPPASPPAFARARTWRLAPVLVAALASGCASIPPTAGTDARDPLEKINRNVYAFNDAVDSHALRPVAEVYEKYVPRPVQSCIRNFFGNLSDVPTALNEFLQGKVGNGVGDVCRVAINTTVGLFGCFDVAGNMGLAKHDEDFGQTLGAWGVPPGPYLVLPLLGSSTVRDGLGRVADFRVQPQRAVKDEATYYSLSAVGLVDTRAMFLPASRLIDQSGLDPYGATRDAYLQRRRNLVFDGNPPDEPERAPPKYDDDDAAPATPPRGDTSGGAQSPAGAIDAPKPETNKPDPKAPGATAPAPIKPEDNESEPAKAGAGKPKTSPAQ